MFTTEVHMPMRLPVTLVAEYRGQAPASEFTDRDTGEVVSLAPNYKFEVELPDGDVAVWAVREGQLDDAADFDVAKLAKGERVTIVASVVLQDRGSKRDSYIAPHKITRVTSNGRPAPVPA
jgi:hypothetical protein